MSKDRKTNNMFTITAIFNGVELATAKGLTLDHAYAECGSEVEKRKGSYLKCDIRYSIENPDCQKLVSSDREGV